MRDDTDNGSIIDFVQKRQGMNLGQVRRELRGWLGEAPTSYEPKAPAPLGRKPIATESDRQRVFVVWSKIDAANGQHP